MTTSTITLELPRNYIAPSFVRRNIATRVRLERVAARARAARARDALFAIGSLALVVVAAVALFG
ncbi:MAG TPA: hypothetical protein VMJ10_03940 [Kofleriaceae bacterium]|nr:hypothetical protein [Kofleriaceae bacterium]